MPMIFIGTFEFTFFILPCCLCHAFKKRQSSNLLIAQSIGFGLAGAASLGLWILIGTSLGYSYTGPHIIIIIFDFVAATLFARAKGLCVSTETTTPKVEVVAVAGTETGINIRATSGNENGTAFKTAMTNETPTANGSENNV